MSDDQHMRDEYDADWAPGVNPSNLGNHASSHTGSHNNRGQGASEPEIIPSELRGVYSRLRTDGAAWSATTVAAPDTLIRYAQALPQMAPQTRTGRMAQPPAIQQPLATQEPPAVAQRPPLASRPPRDGARRGAHWPTARWAPVAAVVIVALVAAVFYGFAIRFRPPVVGTTAPKTATATIIHGKWIDLTRLDYTATYATGLGYPVVASSDPQVVYEPLSADAHGQSTVGLRRTDDGGTSWHTLPLPTPNTEIAAIEGIAISPLDAHVVILSLRLIGVTSCPSGVDAQNAIDSSLICDLQYISRDGGAHWRLLSLPLAGLLQQAGGFSTGFTIPSTNPLYVQGNRLYAMATGEAPPTASFRLLSSTDGGLTWRFVDAPLGVAGSNNLCAFTATPTGATIFAATITGSPTCGLDGAYILWRSDDAGASWRQVATLPTHLLDGLLVSAQPSAAPILYADFPQPTTGPGSPLTPYDLYMSSDGGRTWSPLSSTGIAFATPASTSVTTGLPHPWQKGSVIRAYGAPHDPASATVYVWAPTTRHWQPLVPAVAGSSQGVISLGGGGITLISSNFASGIVPPNRIVTYTFWRYVF